MTDQARKVSGYILLSVPTIIYGGWFLLTILSGQQEYWQLTGFQKAMFRAGHAHAGVLVLLALLVQFLADYAILSDTLKWLVRLSFPAAAVTVSAGFFVSSMGYQVTQPNGLIGILYIGIAILLFGLMVLGIGLVRSKKDTF